MRRLFASLARTEYMTPKERFQAALEMRAADRVPLFYQHLGGAKWVAASCGRRIREGYSDPEAFAEISMAAQRLFGFDNVMASWGDILVEAHAHGTQWRFPERDFYPRPLKYAIEGPADVDKIVPIDPMDDECWSIQLKGAKIMNDRIGKEIEVVACIDSPFVIASEVMGYEKLMMALLSSPGDVEKLVATLTESSKAYAERAASYAGLESIFIENGMAGGDMVRLPMCQRYDLTYAKQVVDRCRSLGLKTIIHNCAAKPYLEAEAEMMPDCIHFNNKYVDLPKTFASLRGRLCVMSGIDHMELMFTGSPEEVEAETKRVIELYGREPGLILAPGCEMPFKIPVENVARLKHAAETYGRQ